MVSCTIIVTLRLVVCLSVVYGKPESLPSGQPQCQLMDGIMQCMGLWMAFLMSPEGQQFDQLGKAGANLSQIFTENIFNTICRLAPAHIACFADVMGRCEEPEFQAGFQMMARTNAKLFSVCNETDGYSKVNTVIRCGEKIKIPIGQCASTIGNSIAESLRLNFSNSSSDPMEVLRNQNYQKEYCCLAKKFEECIAPSVQSTCTSEEKTVTGKFKDRILQGLQCTDVIYQTC